MNVMTQPSRADIEEALDLTAARKGRKWLRRAVWLIVIAAIMVGAVYGYRTMTASNAAVVYDTVDARTADLTVTVSATGTIQPITQVDVSS